MSDDPIRLREDPRVSNALRRDLARAAQQGIAAPGFDVSSALASFEAARVNVSGRDVGSRQGTRLHAMRSARWWGVGAVGIATLLAAVFVSTRRSHSTAASMSQPVRARASNPTTLTPQSDDTRSAPSIVTPSAREPDTHVALADDVNATTGSARQAATARSSGTVSLAARNTLQPVLRNASSSAPPAASAATDASAGAHGTLARARIAAAGTGEDLLERDERMLTDTYALLDGDPARALSLADVGIRAFPSSRHLEDREAIAVRALAALHRSAEARARGTRFLARWPSSPQGLMVRQAMMR
jgi:hypothetical protein